MKFLCLAYGDESRWHELPQDEQNKMLAQDEVLRHRGDYVAAVEPEVTTITAWGGIVKAVQSPFAKLRLPLAGFSIVEAESLDEAISLIAGTPCAQAGGAVEVRLIDESVASDTDSDLAEDALEPPEFAARTEWCSPK